MGKEDGKFQRRYLSIITRPHVRSVAQVVTTGSEHSAATIFLSVPVATKVQRGVFDNDERFCLTSQEEGLAPAAAWVGQAGASPYS